MPEISIVLPTYNRPHLLPVAIESILNQSYRDLELIVINNGSGPETGRVLDTYSSDPRLRVITLTDNIGFARASNLGFDAIRGRWFSLMSDDDHLLPEALEKLIAVPHQLDASVNAVSCNCMSIHNGKFTGKGLTQSDYLQPKDVIEAARGEFWGITRTDLLGDLRFNPNVSDDVNHLWYQIDLVARRYYLHQGLKYYDDGVGGRVSSPSRFRMPKQRARHYRYLRQEEAYWQILREYAPAKFKSKVLKACIVLELVNDQESLQAYQAMLEDTPLHLREQIMMGVFRTLPRRMAYSLFSAMPA
ncbi:MAG: glycosyltransferase family 2 protein [Bacteroidota bacterium]